MKNLVILNYILKTKSKFHKIDQRKDRFNVSYHTLKR